mgnify:CR=1 FL=1
MTGPVGINISVDRIIRLIKRPMGSVQEIKEYAGIVGMTRPVTCDIKLRQNDDTESQCNQYPKQGFFKP